MTSNAIPTSVSFFTGSTAASQPSRAAEAPPTPPPTPNFVPMLPEDMNLDGMTKRALSMALGTQVDLIV